MYLVPEVLKKMDDLIEVVRPISIPVTELHNRCNINYLFRKPQDNNNGYYPFTDTREENSESEGCVDFNYAEVASENEDNDESLEQPATYQPHGDIPETNGSNSDESSVIIKSVFYFNSLKNVEVETGITTPETHHFRRTISSGLLMLIAVYNNSQLEKDIKESGNVALRQYIHPVEEYLPMQTYFLPETLTPEFIHTNLLIDKTLGQMPVSPVFRKYQLLGDSQLVRFSQVLLGLRKWSLKSHKSRIGYCVSGQRIAELGARIRASECKLNPNVIVLIGTNDMRRNIDILTIIQSYSDLVSQLSRLCEKIVLLTIPPLPFLHDQNPETHIDKLRIINKFIQEQADGENIFVVDLCAPFLSFDNSVSRDCFEEFLRFDKIDMIHLNKSGFNILRTLLDNLFEKYKI